jgi:hypothetical protein
LHAVLRGCGAGKFERPWQLAHHLVGRIRQYLISERIRQDKSESRDNDGNAMLNHRSAPSAVFSHF